MRSKTKPVTPAIPTVREALEGPCGEKCPVAGSLSRCHAAHPPKDRHAVPGRDYQAVYSEFWQDLLEEHGELNRDLMMRELSDYAMLLDQIPKVYSELTNGHISKPFTTAEAVIAEVEDCQNQLNRDMKKDLMTELEGRKVIKVSDLKRLLDSHF